MGPEGVVVLLIVLTVAVLAAPVLAVVAFVRLGAIDARLQALERRLAPDSKPGEAAAVPDPVAPPAATSLPPLPPPGGGFDLEAVIAGRWLHYAGLFLVLVASAFFLKLVIDNAWIGPTGQVALGLAGGAGVMAAGQRFYARGYRYFSEGLTGLGAGMLYLSLWAGTAYHGLLPPAAGFIAMIVVTAAQATLAVARSSERLALLALTGGLLTPALTGRSGGTTDLFVYLVILDASLLALAFRRDWRWMAPVAFLFTQVYFWNRYDCCRQPGDLAMWMSFASTFFVIFAALPALRAHVALRLRPDELVVTLLNTGAYLLALREFLWPDRPWTLTVAMLALAAAHLALARLVPRASRDGEAPQAHLLYAGLALLFVTLAIPVQFDGGWLTMAWAIEAGILMWTGFRAPLAMLRGAAFVILALVGLRLLASELPADRFLLNIRFATFAVAVVAGALGVALWRRQPERVTPGEQPLFGALGVFVNVLALVALSAEVYDALAAPAGVRGEDARSYGFGQQLGLSLVWTTYAAGLMMAGVRQAVAALRWQALALFGLTVAKVLAIDLSFLQGGYRVISSVALGGVLIVVSLLYQRRMAAGRARQGGQDGAA